MSNSLSKISRSAFEKYFKNTSWMLLDKFFRMGLTLVVGIYVTNHLGLEQVGVFGNVLAYIGIFGILPTLGIYNILLRDLSASKSNKGEILGTAFMMQFALAILTVLLVGLSVFTLENEDAWLIFVASATFIFLPFRLIDFYFQSEVKAKYGAIAQIIAFGIVSGLKILFIFKDYGVDAFVFLLVIEAFLTGIFLLFAYLNYRQEGKAWRFNKQIATSFLKQSWFHLLASAMAVIYLKIDQIMIVEMISKEANGIYSTAVRFSEAFYILPAIIANSVMPAIVQAKQKSEILYRERIQQLINLLGMGALAVAIVSQFASEPFIQLVFKEEFWPASEVLIWHIWAALFMFVGVGAERFLLIENKHSFFFYKGAVGMGSNVVLNFWLIPKFGVMGAVYATLVSYCLASYVMLAFAKSTRSIFIMQTKGLLFPVFWVAEKLSRK
jgi:O-antigen/teichoic acid export membrane protein